MTRICFTADRFDINGNSIALPLPINELESILGEACVLPESITLFIPPELGIKAYSKERKLVETVDVVLNLKIMNIHRKKFYRRTLTKWNGHKGVLYQ